MQEQDRLCCIQKGFEMFLLPARFGSRPVRQSVSLVSNVVCRLFRRDYASQRTDAQAHARCRSPVLGHAPERGKGHRLPALERFIGCQRNRDPALKRHRRCLKGLRVEPGRSDEAASSLAPRTKTIYTAIDQQAVGS